MWEEHDCPPTVRLPGLSPARTPGQLSGSLKWRKGNLQDTGEEKLSPMNLGPPGGGRMILGGSHAVPSTGAILKPAFKYGLALCISPRTYLFLTPPAPSLTVSLTGIKSLFWRRISQDGSSVHGFSYDFDFSGLDTRAATAALFLILVSSI